MPNQLFASLHGYSYLLLHNTRHSRCQKHNLQST
uniref:Uncharacterized protein n=1 Tax=Rhizophora mucronata TaxID=61149 RepID=A0A2P2NC96_RHIMU